GLFLAFYFNFFLYASSDFFQRQLDFYAEVATFQAGSPSAAESAKTTESATKSTAKNVPELGEDIFHVHSSTAKSASSSFKCRMTVLVIFCPFVRVAKHFIGFCRLFEFFFRFFIARIFVRVVFYRLFAVSLFDCGSVCTFINA